MTCFQTLVMCVALPRKSHGSDHEQSGSQEAFGPRSLWTQLWIPRPWRRLFPSFSAVGSNALRQNISRWCSSGNCALRCFSISAWWPDLNTFHKGKSLLGLEPRGEEANIRGAVTKCQTVRIASFPLPHLIAMTSDMRYLPLPPRCPGWLA